MNFSISELKKHLGPGLGLRKNRYMMELPVPTVNGETLNILCQAAGLPERNISTTDVWHKGRRYTIRGETDFVGEYEISILDDDKMRIRQLFDDWIKKIDNTRPDKNSSLLGASFEGLQGVEEILTIANNTKNTITNSRQSTDFIVGQMNKNAQLSAATYQTDINIWQMDRPSSGFTVDDHKVYGYKLQNAFPKSIGIVTLEDGDENTLSEFSVTFAFSEFIPLYGMREDLFRAVVGDQVGDIVDAFKQLQE